MQVPICDWFARYNSKSSKRQRDERYKERLKATNFEKYKERVMRSSVRAKVSQWQKQLGKDYRDKQQLLKEVEGRVSTFLLM